MARFRPSRLFRRLSSRGDRSPTRDLSPPPTAAATPSSSSKVPLYSAKSSPKELRKVSSFPRLRSRPLANSPPGEEISQIPEVVRERTDLPVFGLESIRSAEELGRQQTPPRSEDVGGGRPSDESVVEAGLDGEFGDRRAQAGSTVPKLPEVRALRKQPVVVLQEATPDIEEEARRVERSGSNSSVLTFSEFTPDGEALSSPPAKDTHDKGLPLGPSRSRPASSESIPAVTSTNPLSCRFRPPSIVDTANADIIRTLLDAPQKSSTTTAPTSNFSPSDSSNFLSPSMQNMTSMMHRKIWVKRPGASATLVQIRESDLVDDVRDMILKKYANSLGRTFDAPDMTLLICPRSGDGNYSQERLLGPEEDICRSIDTHFPGGQTVDEALIIHVPQKRTPKPSPRALQYAPYQVVDDYRPMENGTEYFPMMPAAVPATVPQTTGSHDSRSGHHQPTFINTSGPEQHLRSMSVLNTGQVPPLPSPGAINRRHQHRPKQSRQHTASPTTLTQGTGGPMSVKPGAHSAQQPHMAHRQSTRPRLDSTTSDAAHHGPNGVPLPPPLPSPPAPEAAPTNKTSGSDPQSPSGGIVPTYIPNLRTQRPKKTRKSTSDNKASSRGHSSKIDSDHAGTSVSSMLDATVPPISVLIVEDNIINLRILEGLMKRLKVRWQTAMNGQIAVDKWRGGGFHLVLMDIQMPIMNGLQATKEIRRLERVNGIGVFGEVESPDALEDEPNTASANANPERTDTTSRADKSNDNLASTGPNSLFKSPVIIVALTASSLQSDRNEALAAGCNDFLTKPVNFVWLERKVKEWGCMQALIDFDGWRKWKEYAAVQEANKTEEERQKDAEKAEKERVRAEKMAKLQEKQAKVKEEREREEARKKQRVSLAASDAGADGGGADKEVGKQGKGGSEMSKEEQKADSG